jgi:hypothetical protein
MKHVKQYESKINEYDQFQDDDQSIFILNKINDELKPNKVTFNGDSVTYNNKATLFNGDLNDTILYLNGLYQGIMLKKAIS